jgi:hypothetical protein
MLRAEQRHKVDIGRSQSHHVTDTLGIDAGLIGYQTNPAVADQVYAVLEQHDNAGAHASVIIRLDGTGYFLTLPGGAADPPPTHSP